MGYLLINLVIDIFCMLGQWLLKHRKFLALLLDLENEIFDRRLQTVEHIWAVISLRRLTDHWLTSLDFIKAKPERGGCHADIVDFRLYVLVERFELLIQSAMRGLQIFDVWYNRSYVNLWLWNWLLKSFEFLHQILHVGSKLLDLFFNLSNLRIVRPNL